MTDLILHHYEASPFSEIVRLALGIKGATWKSVLIPRIMPKPDFTPLTGGYRKTPALQIGADIYCDTLRIVEEINERVDGPDLFPKGSKLMSAMMSSWLGSFFKVSATLKLSAFADKLPEEFWADRAAIFGMNKDKMLAAEPLMRDQWRAFVSHIDAHLADTGNDFLLGDQPSHSDCIAYMIVWFAWGNENAINTVKSLDHVNAWYQRLADIGHGTSSEMTPTEALAIAKAGSPAVAAVEDSSDLSGRNIGDHVAVLTEDHTPCRVEGKLAALTPTTISVIQENETVGETSVSFPRIGYLVMPA